MTSDLERDLARALRDGAPSPDAPMPNPALIRRRVTLRRTVAARRRRVWLPACAAALVVGIVAAGAVYLVPGWDGSTPPIGPATSPAVASSTAPPTARSSAQPSSAQASSSRPSPSRPSQPPPARTTTGAAVATVGGAPLGNAPCIVPLPGTWQAALAAGTLWQPQVHQHLSPWPPTPDGLGVLSQQDGSGVAQIVIRGKDYRTVESFGEIPDPSGKGEITFAAVGAGDAAFVFAPNGNQTWQWSMYLADLSTRSLTVIARNPVDKTGAALPVGWVQPVFSGQYLYWIQAADDEYGPSGSELVQYNLTTGNSRVLYRGWVQSFVPYQGTILYSAIVPGTQVTPTSQPEPMELFAVNADTAAKVSPPSGLAFAQDGSDFVQSSGDVIVWTTNDSATTLIRAWSAAWGRTITLVPNPSDWPAGKAAGITSVTDLRTYQHFAVFNASGGTFVMDLATGSIARLQRDVGGDDMSGSWLAMWSTTTPLSDAKSTGKQNDGESVIDLATLPDLPQC